MSPKKAQSSNPAYYKMSSDYRGNSPGMKILNYDTLQRDRKGITPAVGWPDGYLTLPKGPWRFPDYVEVPRILIDARLGRTPRDLEDFDGIWVISGAMKAVLLSVDPAACEFRPCETILRSGESGRESWLCTVTRAFVGAVDPAGSENLDVRKRSDGLSAYAMDVTWRLRERPWKCDHLNRGLNLNLWAYILY